jgi:hypothetical protein
MTVLIVGSIGLDTVETPFGKKVVTLGAASSNPEAFDVNLGCLC